MSLINVVFDFKVKRTSTRVLQSTCSMKNPVFLAILMQLSPESAYNQCVAFLLNDSAFLQILNYGYLTGVTANLCCFFTFTLNL